MNEWLWAIIGLVVGSLGVLVLALIKRAKLHTDLSNAQVRIGLLEEQLQKATDELSVTNQEKNQINLQREIAEKRIATLNEQILSKERELEDKEALSNEFEALSAKVLKSSNQQFLILAEAKFKPIKETLEKYNQAVREIESKREKAYAKLDEQINQIAQSNEKLGSETTKLVSALRRPEQRGRWGEMQLRNTVELAGMVKHCDFIEQPTVRSDEGHLRPDMIVNLPGGGVIVVDSKVALDAYLDSIEADADSKETLGRHAKQVVDHYKKLAHKRYWEQFERTPQFVVMFMPLESALTAALEVQPHLIAEAIKDHVIIATPTLLIALLQATAYGWQQEDVAANAREISNTGKELYDRLKKFVEHFEKVGSGLARASDSYNSAIGSLERMVLPSARRLKELHATTEAEIELPSPIEIETRQISTSELKPVQLSLSKSTSADEEEN
ncbi:MAG: DNA recombination protein RmuC [Planctomycetes bacterium]|nr:DNA recombination protein RmuC [Planctomycetota bacterium]